MKIENIFLTWKHKHVPAALKACVNSCKINLNGAKIFFYDDQEALDFVETYYPEFLSVYLGYPSGILRADIWRVLVLYKFGGVYADIDVECLRPLDQLLEKVGHDDWELLLTTDHPVHERIHFGGRTMWMNDFMIAKPGARFLKEVIDNFSSMAGGDHQPADAVMVTGPGLFARLVNSAGGPAAAGVTPLPWEWIHPLPDMSNEFSESQEYLQKIRDRTWREDHDPFVVHYWHHTWCKAGNMLNRWGHLLHQTDGEIAERRLWRFEEEIRSELGSSCTLIAQLGRGFAEFANTGEKVLWIIDCEPEVIQLVTQILAGLGREIICFNRTPLSAVDRKKLHGLPGVAVMGENGPLHVTETQIGFPKTPEGEGIYPLTTVRLPSLPLNWQLAAEQYGAPALLVAPNMEWPNIFLSANK